MESLWNYLNSGDFARLATWGAIWSLLVIAIATCVYMIYLGPKILLDWAYAWIMFALAGVIIRLLYLEHVANRMGSSFLGSMAWVNLALACGFTFVVLVRNGYQLMREEGESHGH